eukprot:gene25891-34857_t
MYGGSFIEVDGKEGGGQILRNTLSYAALMGKPVRIRNIRQGAFPPSSIAGAELCGRMSRGSRTSGFAVGSTAFPMCLWATGGGGDNALILRGK